MKCSGEDVILRGIFYVVFRFPLHFMLYRGNLDYLLDSAYIMYLCTMYSVHCTVYSTRRQCERIPVIDSEQGGQQVGHDQHQGEEYHVYNIHQVFIPK